ncbi:32547_t:CDS:2, partial [Racocetra persica]
VKDEDLLIEIEDKDSIIGGEGSTVGRAEELMAGKVAGTMVGRAEETIIGGAEELQAGLETNALLVYKLIAELNMIVENTNYYAVAKSAAKGREWVPLTVEELLIWLALVIYMGIFKLPSREDYWKTDWKYPQHKVIKYMTLVRFEQ